MVYFAIQRSVRGAFGDGGHRSPEPPVVEGPPPMPMVVQNRAVAIDGRRADRETLRVALYPTPGSESCHPDAVVKVSFSAPVRGVDGRTFTLTDSHGAWVPAWVDQIGDSAWGLFANDIVL